MTSPFSLDRGVQLTLEQIRLRAIAAELPAIETPVVRWRKLVRRVDPPSAAGVSPRAMQGVASALADYANRNGRDARPSVQTLAVDARYHRRTVQRALRALERLHLVVSHGIGGRGRATRYSLWIPPVEQVDDPEKGGEIDAKGCQGRHPRSEVLMSVVLVLDDCMACGERRALRDDGVRLLCSACGGWAIEAVA